MDHPPLGKPPLPLLPRSPRSTPLTTNEVWASSGDPLLEPFGLPALRSFAGRGLTLGSRKAGASLLNLPLAQTSQAGAGTPPLSRAAALRERAGGRSLTLWSNTGERPCPCGQTRSRLSGSETPHTSGSRAAFRPKPQTLTPSPRTQTPTPQPPQAFSVNS